MQVLQLSRNLKFYGGMTALYAVNLFCGIDEMPDRRFMTFQSFGFTMAEFDEAIFRAYPDYSADILRQMKSDAEQGGIHPWSRATQHDRALRQIAVYGADDRTEYVLKAAARVLDAHGEYIESEAQLDGKRGALSSVGASLASS